MVNLCSAKCKAHDKSEGRHLGTGDRESFGEGQEKAPASKRLVVDLDGTLFKRNFWARFWYNLHLWCYKQSIRSQKIDGWTNTVILLNKYSKKKVIILTGRDERLYKEETLKQLKRHGIHYDEFIICPNSELVMDWKKKFIEKNDEWLDDEK